MQTGQFKTKEVTMTKKEKDKLVKERDRIQEKLFCPTPYVYRNFRKFLRRVKTIDMKLTA